MSFPITNINPHAVSRQNRIVALTGTVIALFGTLSIIVLSYVATLNNNINLFDLFLYVKYEYVPIVFGYNPILFVFLGMVTISGVFAYLGAKATR